MSGLRHHQTATLIILLVAVTWGAVFVVYDYRSPISQFLRGVGTVQLEGWSAYDLDTQCVRLETPDGSPATTAEAASSVARGAYPGGYVREVLLVSFHDTCSSASPRLAWAVALAWLTASGDPSPTGPRPQAVVIVDAGTGQLVANHGEWTP